MVALPSQCASGRRKPRGGPAASLPVVHPNRYWPGHGDALAAPMRGAVVRDRVVLGGAVVPDGQVTLPRQRTVCSGRMM